MRSAVYSSLQMKRAVSVGDPTLIVEITSGAIFTGMALWMLFGKPEVYLYRSVRLMFPAWVWIFIIFSTGVAQIVAAVFSSKGWRGLCMAFGLGLWAMFFVLLFVRGVNLGHFVIGPFMLACTASFIVLVRTVHGSANERDGDMAGNSQ